MSYITFENVCKDYPAGDSVVHAADHVSFGIEKGELCVILGHSGAGKTTVLNLLGGMDRASSGRITVGDRVVTDMNDRRLTEYRRLDVGFVFQFYNLMHNLTALENVELAQQVCPNALNPAEVTSGEMLSGRLRVGQKGGAGNSLGRIVFRFPNNFSVYLHDTNNRGAFNRDRRTLSHGCIRVQKPFDLACFLLPDADEWTKDRLRISMDIQPETTQGQIYVHEHAGDPKPFRLMSYQDVNPKVPLYIIYYTAYPNPKTGEVELWPDLYGYDQAISREMGSILL
jgi:ABC-type oligopeptide transport system ATPase subunit